MLYLNIIWHSGWDPGMGWGEQKRRKLRKSDKV